MTLLTLSCDRGREGGLDDEGVSGGPSTVGALVMVKEKVCCVPGLAAAVCPVEAVAVVCLASPVWEEIDSTSSSRATSSLVSGAVASVLMWWQDPVS